jgi:hypothetical protein
MPWCYIIQKVVVAGGDRDMKSTLFCLCKGCQIKATPILHSSYSAKHDFPITLGVSQEIFCDLFTFFSEKKPIKIH